MSNNLIEFNCSEFEARQLLISDRLPLKYGVTLRP
jgi:hypothetical protein